MKKRLLTVLLVVILALSVASFAACGQEQEVKIGVVGVVGVEKHTYFPYAVVTVDMDNKPIVCEIGECFGPSGKVWVETNTAEGQAAYNNPWYPGFSAIVTAFYAATDDAGRNTAVAGKYISINGEIFELSWRDNVELVKRSNSYLPNDADPKVTIKVLTFKNVETGEWLTDEFIAENMQWYLAAINSNSMFPCNQSGTKTAIDGKYFQDGAPRKNDMHSTYQPGRGLAGPQLNLAMKALAEFAMSKNFVIEYENCTVDGRPQRIKGFDYGLLIDQFPGEIVTSASSKAEATYLHYGKSYIECAVAAYQKVTAEE